MTLTALVIGGLCVAIALLLLYVMYERNRERLLENATQQVWALGRERMTLMKANTQRSTT